MAVPVLDLASFPPEELSEAEALMLRDDYEDLIDSLSEAELEALRWDWGFWGRPDQQWPEGDWRIALVLAGRGSGKTRTAAEWTRERARRAPSRGALIAPTPADARDIMVEGEAGILAVSPPGERPSYEPSKRRLTWPNGTIATIFSGAEPEAIRGPTLDWAWVDELRKFKFLQQSWDNLRFAMRRGLHPQTWITTTPIPVAVLRQLVDGAYPGTIVRRVSTYRNLANLAPDYIEELLARYEGTRLGRQELHAEILEDVEGALWQMDMIEPHRIEAQPDLPALRRIVVAVDPSWGVHGDECGIVVAGVGWDNHGYVLDDLSLRAPPAEWGAVVRDAYSKWKADRIVAEANFQAEQVKLVMQTVDRRLSFKEMHASRGKQIRAEPVVALYEQEKVHHVGRFGLLEQQLTEWVPPAPGQRGPFSPDRLDALVWALTELMLHGGGPAKATSAADVRLPKSMPGRGGIGDLRVRPRSR